MRIRRKLGLLVGGFTLLFSSLGGTVFAAGSAQITLESAAGGVAGSEQEIRLYVTPTGAPLYTVQTTINLANMTFVSYTPNGTYFALFNSAASGGSVGSTSFTIGASHQGLAETAAGTKAFVGTIRVQLGGSAGTATASQTAHKADDAIDVSPMATSAPARSMTITAAQSPTCPAGQVGTPPNCTTPSTGGNGGGGGSGTTNPVNNPNPGSSAVVPTAGGSAENPTAEVLSESEYSDIMTASAQDNDDAIVATTTKTNAKLPLIAGGAAALLLIVVAGGLILARVRSNRPVRSHVASPMFPSSESSAATNNDTDIQSGDKNEPPTPPSGPTIIRPGQ